MNCHFIPLKKGARVPYRCTRCGFTTPPCGTSNIKRECPSLSQTDDYRLPTLTEKAIHFAHAMSRWELAGRPERSDEEINLIVAKACTSCKFYNGEICTHKNCGCNVQTTKEEQDRKSWRGRISKAMQNKVRMATEDCPLQCTCGHSRWRHLQGGCDQCACNQFRERGTMPTTSAPVILALTSKQYPKCLEIPGYNCQCLEGPTIKEVEKQVEALRPLIVVNRAMLVSPEEIHQLALRFSRTAWVTVNHSSQSYLLVADHLAKQTKFIQLAERYENCFFAYPEYGLDLLNSKVRCFWLPNTTNLPPNPVRPAKRNSPLTLSLICRRDIIKNIPNQIMGAALARRTLDVQLLLITRGRADDLLSYAQLLDLPVLLRDWCDGRPDWFADVASGIDIGLQVSFNESFNYVCLDHIKYGIPVVGSSAIRYIPAAWMADPSSPRDIADKILDTARDLEPRSQLARSLAEKVVEYNTSHFQKTMRWLHEQAANLPRTGSDAPSKTTQESEKL